MKSDNYPQRDFGDPSRPIHKFHVTKLSTSLSLKFQRKKRLKMAERSEAKSAKRSFASKYL